ncbi:hypothetical protein CF319_g627 [Tilletia indica]|nr:hypothetical protein CF319_g627 [Tilletia indica]
MSSSSASPAAPGDTTLVPPTTPSGVPPASAPPSSDFVFNLGASDPAPSTPTTAGKRRKAGAGKSVPIPSSRELEREHREAKYERLRSLGTDALIELVRQQDDLIASLLSAKSEVEKGRREDSKTLRGALDVLGASMRGLKETVESRCPSSGSLSASGSSSSFPPLSSSPSRTSGPSSSASQAGRSLAQVAADAAALPLRSRGPRRSPAEALLSATQAPRSSAASVSAVRSQLKSDDFAVVSIEGFRRMEHSATKQILSDMGVDVRHVHNVSHVGSVLELVVSKSHREVIVKAITQVPEGLSSSQCLRVNDNFDASQPIRSGANSELKEKVLSDFNSRMRRLQARASEFGWSGLSDFFAGRIQVSSRRASVPAGSVDGAGAVQVDAAMEDVSSATPTAAGVSTSESSA